MKNKGKFISLLSVALLASCGTPTTPSEIAPTSKAESVAESTTPVSEGGSETVSEIVSQVTSESDPVSEEISVQEPENPDARPSYLEVSDGSYIFPIIDLDSQIGDDEEEIIKTDYDYSDVSFANINGRFAFENGVYTSQSTNVLAVCETVPFKGGTFSCDIKANNTSDNGLVIGYRKNQTSKQTWEGQGIEYYFVFMGQGGSAYIGKTSNGTWSALKTIQVGAWSDQTTYNFKVVLRGKLIMIFINGDYICSYKDENFLRGTGFGLRAGGGNVTFSNVTISNDFIY